MDFEIVTAGFLYFGRAGLWNRQHETQRMEYPMTTVRIDAAHEIGTAAGAIWQYLSSNGAVPIPRLVKDLEQPREMILQGIGWLAREGKIEDAAGKGKARLVRLSE